MHKSIQGPDPSAETERSTSLWHLQNKLRDTRHWCTVRPSQGALQRLERPKSLRHLQKFFCPCRRPSQAPTKCTTRRLWLQVPPQECVSRPSSPRKLRSRVFNFGHDDDRFSFCYRIRQWEQSQLQAFTASVKSVSLDHIEKKFAHSDHQYCTNCKILALHQLEFLLPETDFETSFRLPCSNHQRVELAASELVQHFVHVADGRKPRVRSLSLGEGSRGYTHCTIAGSFSTFQIVASKQLKPQEKAPAAYYLKMTGKTFSIVQQRAETLNFSTLPSHTARKPTFRTLADRRRYT